ncbi:protein lethal(2)essential for life-like [Neocloeon triangulifer]|uniref:protein lethal(2)essential for life-like n=1 Tax=Neocloeon triangulifer TaxID=2078957 RepID=UPI00286F2A9A|nr:protein lethal(2)essential for life-like [Neocloeon triangulifer]
MSMVPMMFRDWWDDFELPRSRLWDNSNFGLGLHRDDLFRAHNSMLRPWTRRQQSAIVHPIQTETANADNSVYSTVLDVSQFTPAELSVKVQGNAVVVEGKHEERADDHGYISRHFVRRYVLPEQYDLDQVNSSLSSDGVLTISAPKKCLPGSGERVVLIQQTGVPAVKSAAVTNEPTITHPQTPQPI